MCTGSRWLQILRGYAGAHKHMHDTPGGNNLKTSEDCFLIICGSFFVFSSDHRPPVYS